MKKIIKKCLRNKFHEFEHFTKPPELAVNQNIKIYCQSKHKNLLSIKTWKSAVNTSIVSDIK